MLSFEKTPRGIPPLAMVAAGMVMGRALQRGYRWQLKAEELERDNALLEMAAESDSVLIALALKDNAKHKQELHRDQMTGLLNEAGLKKAFEGMRARPRRGDEGSSLLYVAMIDLDNFKPINDTYGHDVGDHVLVSVAKCMARTLRGNDVIGRLHGDEFMALIQADNDVESNVAAERIRENVEKLSSDFPQILMPTATIGLADVRAGDDFESMSKRADEAMYEAKRAGRNMVYFMDI